MACPYFDPLEPWPQSLWHGPARLPLGQPWKGRCTAPGAEHDPADEEVQRQFCNFGYARGRCSRFPDDSPSEAHRFSCAAQHGSRYKIIWIEERECTPLRHEVLEVTCGRGRDTSVSLAAVAMRQAQAFADSCSGAGSGAQLQAHLGKSNA